MKTVPQWRSLLQDECNMLYVLSCLCTDATLGLHLGIPVVGRQGKVMLRTPFCLSFFGGENLFRVQRKMCSSLSHLRVQYLILDLFLPVFLNKENSRSGGTCCNLLIYAQNKSFQLLQIAWSPTAPERGEEAACPCLLALGSYRPAGLRLCSSSPSPAPPVAGFVLCFPVSLLYFSPLNPQRCTWLSPASPWPREIH